MGHFYNIQGQITDNVILASHLNVQIGVVRNWGLLTSLHISLQYTKVLEIIGILPFIHAISVTFMFLNY